MVDHSRCREPSLCFATHTQGMPAEVRLAQPLPLAAVATLGGRRSVWVQELMLRTIQTVCQVGTAGMLAWFQCLPRHKVHLRIQKAASDEAAFCRISLFLDDIAFTVEQLGEKIDRTPEELIDFVDQMLGDNIRGAKMRFGEVL